MAGGDPEATISAILPIRSGLNAAMCPPGTVRRCTPLSWTECWRSIALHRRNRNGRLALSPAAAGLADGGAGGVAALEESGGSSSSSVGAAALTTPIAVSSRARSVSTDGRHTSRRLEVGFDAAVGH